jgi:hypothetical protein
MSGEPSNEQSPWPPTPNWAFAAVCVGIMLLAVFLVWLSNWREVQKIRSTATPSSQTSATAPARNP